jgi:phage terminase large subunit GpA-like protein
MSIICTAIDTGGHYTHDVYNYVRHRTARVIAIKGASQPNRPILGHPTKQDVDYRGQVIKNGVMLWPIGTDTAKTRIYARLGIKEPGPGRCHFSADLEDAYYQGLTIERKTTRFDKKGNAIQEWIKPSGARNEPLDCEVYALAAAFRAGVHRANWSQIEISYGLSPTPVIKPAPAISVKSLKKKGVKKGRRISSI